MSQELKRENINPEADISQSENPQFREVVKGLDKNQKISLGFLVIFALVVVVLGSVQMRNNIRAPFDIPAAIKEKLKAEKNQPMVSSTDLAVTDDRNKDTDRDGVSDSDENNIYATSPYLDDSDSDGFTDFEEIKNGTDPNCPLGKSCTASILNTSTSEVPAKTIASSSQGIAVGNGTSTVGAADTQILQDLLSGKSDPNIIRKLLLDSGMDKTQLDQISDEELLKSYEEVLQSQSQNQN